MTRTSSRGSSVKGCHQSPGGWQLFLQVICALLVVVVSRPKLAEGARPVVLRKGPYLTGLTDSGVEVRFELDGSAPVAIEVSGEGAHGGRPRTFEDRTHAAMHLVRASELSAATRYAYVVHIDGRVVGRGRFTTAPTQSSGASLRFLVYGDDRTDPTAHAAVVRALTASPSDFLVNTGDMVEDGGRAEDWQSFFDIEAQLLRDRSLFVAIGNHELYDDRAGANFARYFSFWTPNGAPAPYGTFRLSNVRFFFLNSSHDWDSGEERTWLERELGRSDGEPGLVWRLAVMHQGPWSSGPHGGSAMLTSAHVPELLASHHVDLLFSGHDHIYERGDSGGMKYVVTGGGGAPLYRASKIASTRKVESTYHFVDVTTDGNALRLLARRIDGSLLDQCVFHKGERWDCDAAATNEISPSDRSDAADANLAGALERGAGARTGAGEAVPATPNSAAPSFPRWPFGVLGAAVLAAFGAIAVAGGIRVTLARKRGPRS